MCKKKTVRIKTNCLVKISLDLGTIYLLRTHLLCHKNYVRSIRYKKRNGWCVFRSKKGIRLVDHDILIKKLEYGGVRGKALSFFK